MASRGTCFWCLASGVWFPCRVLLSLLLKQVFASELEEEENSKEELSTKSCCLLPRLAGFSLCSSLTHSSSLHSSLSVVTATAFSHYKDSSQFHLVTSKLNCPSPSPSLLAHYTSPTQQHQQKKKRSPAARLTFASTEYGTHPKISTPVSGTRVLAAYPISC